MSLASSFEPYDRDDGLYDREEWEALFERAVKADPNTADSLGMLFSDLLETISKGRKGIVRVTNTLKYGIEWAYQYTPVPRIAFKTYLYYLEGMLLPPGDVERILQDAIDKAEEHYREMLAAEEVPSKHKPVKR